ncbi:hypothetical protein BGW80DRAFT_1491217 [Lactifluus volemus]|nr:hypothetical protein BGW80DRAFT_1491217 [Lactifluus volemus]
MFWTFRNLVSDLYGEWEDCLMESLKPSERTYFESVLNKTATRAKLTKSLYYLSKFLTKKFGQKVIVLIDEYEVPNNCAYDHGYFDEANDFFWHSVLPALLKSNESLKYAVLVGVTPAKSGWDSPLNNLKTNALHTRNSPFAGMLMFTEPEVIQLRTLANSELELADLKAQYSSYVAAHQISVYNPVSIMSALSESEIQNFWVATGKFPLSNRQFPDGGLDVTVIEDLLTGAEIEFGLKEDVTYSSLALSERATLSLLYYAGYLTMTANDQFKIPNSEVMTDWARWITDDIGSSHNILKTCMEGPQQLNPKLVQVDKEQGALSHKTAERIYHVLFWGLMQSHREKGWEVSIEPQAGGGYIDIHLCHRRKCMAVLIELKSSEKEGDMKRDANKVLTGKQIEEMNYRNPEGLPNIRTLREYGITFSHLWSHVKGRYLELDGQDQWIEKDDPMMSI